MATPSIHATAVAIDGEALLILGPSRSGKSRLAAALIARAARARPIALVGDDRVLLSEHDGELVARPHPRIAGFLERRGLGIVAMDWVAEAPLGGVVELTTHPSPACGRRWADEVGSGEGTCRLGDAASRGGDASHPTPLRGASFSREREKEGRRNLPRLVLSPTEADPDRILAWWDARGAAAAPHLPAKAGRADWPRAKD